MGKKTPPPTPPQETSAAQTGTSVSTAIANAFLQNPSEIGPDGSTRMDQTGSYSFTDSYTGKSYDIPTFTRTTNLSPAQQAIKAESDAAELNMGRLANQQSAKLQSYLNTPVDLSAANVERYVSDRFSDDFNRQWGDQQGDFETQLANQGVRMGSSAYTRAMQDFSTQKANAYDNMVGNQFNTGLQALLTERNQPINEITALMSGSQVSMPQFMGANLSSIPTTDVAGIIQNYDQQRINQAQQKNALTGQVLGGLFGLGGKIIGLSDERAKEDIHRIGETDNGLPIFTYRYKGDDKPQIGLIAQEVEKKNPDAVMTRPDGLKMVDYTEALS